MKLMSIAVSLAAAVIGIIALIGSQRTAHSVEQQRLELLALQSNLVSYQRFRSDMDNADSVIHNADSAKLSALAKELGALRIWANDTSSNINELRAVLQYNFVLGNITRAIVLKTASVDDFLQMKAAIKGLPDVDRRETALRWLEETERRYWAGR